MSDRVSAPIAAPKGGVLNQNYPQLQLHINRVVEWMRASVPFTASGRRHFVPRFGAASLLLQEMPVFVYDHPVIMKEVAPTAFTDFRHIYIAGPFLQSLIESEQANPNTYEVVPLILHEIYHVMLQHHRRLRNAAQVFGDKELGSYAANIAMDRAINARLVIGYQKYPWGKVLSTTGHGLDFPEKYATMTEEEIFREMVGEVNRINREHAQQNQAGNPDQSQKTDKQDQSQAGDAADQDAKGGESSPSQDGHQGKPSEDAQSGETAPTQDDQDGAPSAADSGQAQEGGQSAQDQGQSSEGGGQSQASGAAGQDGQGQDNGQGNGQSAQGASEASGSDAPGQGGAGGQGKVKSPEEQLAEALRNGQGKKNAAGKNGMDGDTSSHTISSKDLAKVLEEHLHSNPELSKVKDALGIPDAGDKAGHAQIESRATRIVENALSKRKESGIGNIMPGQHIDGHANDVIDRLNEPKITWTGAVGEIINGAGKTYEKDMDEPHSVFYVDPGIMGLGGALYQGSEMQKRQEAVILTLIDSSGSVSMEMLRSFFSETRGIAEGADGGARRLFVYSGDTSLRGEPIEVTEENASEILDKVIVPGRGGTNLSAVINQGLAYLREQEIKVDAIVYFTDLFDYPPKLSSLEEMPPPTVFVCPEGHKTPSFSAAVAEYAEVVEITDDAMVDWDLLPQPEDVPTPA